MKNLNINNRLPLPTLGILGNAQCPVGMLGIKLHRRPRILGILGIKAQHRPRILGSLGTSVLILASVLPILNIWYNLN